MQKIITPDIALKAAQAAKAECAKRGWQVAVAVTTPRACRWWCCVTAIQAGSRLPPPKARRAPRRAGASPPARWLRV
uniref:Uncharacterized protein n=1 Tax=mine drainage metagenome TaxID=410659 RepID=E6PPL0_9ZZZZ